MWLRQLLGITVFLAVTGFAAADNEVTVGDSAPKIEVKEFVKGEPVAKFEKGKTYVVEFWATWCGPCRVSIPHLTDLQKKHKDVTFIGVSVFERKPEDVKPFVEKMAEKMDYRVALDMVDAGGAKGSEGFMAQKWMKAANQDGIPTAFIVNGDGKIAWIGHPIQMDKPLADIVAGKWDLAVAAADFKKEAAKKAKLRALYAKLAKARQGDPKEALEALDEAFKDDPSLEDNLGRVKLQLLAGKNGDADKALAYGKHLVDKAKDNENALNEIAWVVVDRDDANKADAQLLKFALEVALRADELAKGENPFVADTLAKVYFDNGEVGKAVTTQERALKFAKGTQLEKDKSLTQRLEKYKKAAK
jgi:thiol-disulfide isomerase/thioredoxin